MGTTAQKLEYLQGTKEQLKTNLIANGVSVPNNTTFRTMTNLVNDILGTGYQKCELKTATLDKSETGTDYNKSITFSGFTITVKWFVMVTLTRIVGNDMVYMVVGKPGYCVWSKERATFNTGYMSSTEITPTISEGRVQLDISGTSSSKGSFGNGTFLMIGFAGEPPAFPEFG